MMRILTVLPGFFVVMFTLSALAQPLGRAKICDVDMQYVARSERYFPTPPYKPQLHALLLSGANPFQKLRGLVKSVLSVQAFSYLDHVYLESPNPDVESTLKVEFNQMNKSLEIETTNVYGHTENALFDLNNFHKQRIRVLGSWQRRIRNGQIVVGAAFQMRRTKNPQTQAMLASILPFPPDFQAIEFTFKPREGRTSYVPYLLKISNAEPTSNEMPRDALSVYLPKAILLRNDVNRYPSPTTYYKIQYPNRPGY